MRAMRYDEHWVHPARTMVQARCVGPNCTPDGLPGKLVMACTLDAEGLCVSCARTPAGEDEWRLPLGPA